MSRIHDLTQEQEDLLSRMYWLDEADEDDVEEIERIKKQLCKIRGDAIGTFEWLSGIYLAFLDDSSRHEDEKKRLKDLADKAYKREKSALGNAERIQNIMLYIGHKFGIDKISTQYGDFVRSVSAGSVVYGDGFDIEKLPEDCVKVIPESKEPIAAPIAEKLRLKIYDPKIKKLDPSVLTVVDEELPGVSLIRKETMRFK